MSFAKKAFLLSSSVFVLSTAITSCAAPAPRSRQIRLNGAGATFPSKIYTRWFSDLAQSGGPRVNYQAIGSGSGRKAFIDQTVDFGASDEPMKVNDMSKVIRGVLQIPMVGGTVAFGYNYDCDLKLSQRQAVKVAMGKITNWSQLDCPPGKLTWVHRSDGSGTTKAFSNSMQAFSPEWDLGVGKSVKWLTGVGGKGNAGVAGIIRNTAGSIGYLNQSYIRDNIKSAALENLNGEFLKPSNDSGAKALSGIKLDQNLAGIDPNPSTKGAYPIATLTWILAYKTGNGTNTEGVKLMLNYLLSDDAQSKAPSLGYIPLNGENLKKSRLAVEKILN